MGFLDGDRLTLKIDGRPINDCKIRIIRRPYSDSPYAIWFLHNEELREGDRPDDGNMMGYRYSWQFSDAVSDIQKAQELSTPLVRTVKKVVKKGDSMKKKPELNLTRMTLRRVGKKVYLKIKIAKSVAEVFQCGSLEKSDRWLDKKGNGLKYWNSLDVKISEKFHNVNILGKRINLTNYGYSLCNRDDINASLLRTEGIGDGVMIYLQGYTSKDEMEVFSTVIGELVKLIYWQFISPITVKTVVEG